MKSASQTAGEPPHLVFLAQGGCLGRLIAAHDWASTTLGPLRTWPVSLKTTVSLILRSNVPIVTLWGNDGVMIYNDAYSVFAGGRHPQLLGSKVREGWPEVADFNDHVMKVGLSGGTLAYRDQELTLHRSGVPEQVWMNLDYSPILDEAGQPAGVIAIVNETTAKVAAERWQAGERDRQHSMFEQAPGFMAMLSGPQHVFELTNAAYRQLVGHRDIIGKSVRAALPEVEGQVFFERLDQVYSTGVPYVGTALKTQLQRTPDAPKEERYIDLVYQPVRNPDGSIMGIVALGVDTTDRIIAERLLRRSEAQFRTFAEAMPNHVWTSAPDGRLNWFNPRVYDFCGAAPGTLDGNGWASIVHPDDLPHAVEHWRDALATGSPYEVEFRLRRHDGLFRWHIARAAPIRDAGGSVQQWIGTNTDIDDQKRVAQALQESERRLQLSQNAAGIASLELDIASGIVIGSERFWELWGLSQRENVHISVLENIVIPEDREVRSNLDTRIQGTATPNVEYRIRRVDTGELRWLSRNIDFVHDATGKPVKMFGVMQDITDRKAAQTRQELLTHELEHRIKNILSTVGAIASQTLRNTDLATARSSFERRLRALAHAHDILTTTRWTNASIGEVVGGTVAAFGLKQFKLSGPKILISPKMALTLALVVNELGTNALKYGALSLPGGTVQIAWSLDPDAVPDTSALRWSWLESGGPSVSLPNRRGFGSLLVERVFGTDFGGTVQIQYHPAGVECVLLAPAPAP